MKPSVNGVSLVLPPLTPAAEAQLHSVIRRAGFVLDAFGIARPGEVPQGTRVLLALGEQNLRILTGEVNIGRYRGHVLNGAPFVVPTYSPDFLLPKKGEENSSKFTSVMIRDIRHAVMVAKNGYTRPSLSYLIDPHPSKAEQWADDFNTRSTSKDYLSVDIETPMKSKKQDESEVEELDLNILRIGFCWEELKAITVPWTPEYMHFIKFLLAHKGKKTTWNGKGFDEPVLAENNMPFNGEHFDAIDFWHVYQPALPRKLEFVSSFFAPHLLPWKHTNKSDFALYNAKDADAGLCCMKGVESEMRKIEIPKFDLEVAA